MKLIFLLILDFRFYFWKSSTTQVFLDHIFLFEYISRILFHWNLRSFWNLFWFLELMNKPVLFSFQTEMPIPLIKKLLFPLQFVILYIKFPHIFGSPAKLFQCQYQAILMIMVSVFKSLLETNSEGQRTTLSFSYTNDPTSLVTFHIAVTKNTQQK